MAEPFSFFREEDEELFQRGWPHLRIPVDGEKADRDPGASALEVLDAIDPVLGVHWPRETATRFVRAMSVAARHHGSAGVDRVLDQGVAARLGEAVEPTADDLRAFLESHLPTPSPYPFHAEDAVFLFEAFLGTDRVLEALVARLEAMPADAWATRGPTSPHLAHQLGFLLRRAAREARPEAAERARRAAAPHAATDVGLRVALAVEGGAGLRRLLESEPERAEAELTDPGRARFLLEHAADEPALVRELAAAHPQPFLGARTIWIAGPELLDGLEVRLRGASAPMIRNLVDQLAPLRHPAVARLMQRLLANKTAKSRAAGWLRDHHVYAAGVLGEEALAISTRKPSRTRKLTEKKLAATLKKVIASFVTEMEKARGNEKKERKAIGKAIAAYVDMRTLAEDPIPSAGATHFLAADPFDDDTPAPFQTLDPTTTERRRWLGFIDDELSTYG